MKPTTVYKKDCDPFVCTSAEQLEYHINQGWFASEKELEDSFKPVAAFVPVISNKDTLRVAELEKEIAELKAIKSGKAPAAADNTAIKDLQDIIAAKDKQIVDMQEDFEELTKQMSEQITELKEQLANKKGK